MEKIEIQRIIYEDLRSMFLEANAYMAKRKFGQRKKNINDTDNPFGHFIKHQTAGGFLRPFTKEVERTLSLIGKEAPVFINMFDALEFDDNSYPHTDANELALRAENLDKILRIMAGDDHYVLSNQGDVMYDTKTRCIRYEKMEIWLNSKRSTKHAQLLSILWEAKGEPVSFDDIANKISGLPEVRGVAYTLKSLDRAILEKSAGKLAGLIIYSEKEKTARIDPQYI